MVKMQLTISASMMDIFKSIFRQELFTFKIRTFAIHTSTTTNHVISLTNTYKNYIIKCITWWI